jgi:hypothetical protein
VESTMAQPSASEPGKLSDVSDARTHKGTE